MRQNRCAHPQKAPTTERLITQRLTVTQSLACEHTEHQVRSLRNREQRLKRLKLPIYDAHTRSHAHARMSPYT
ncbi:hypothetical protein SAMN02787144_102943 [Streptomyces atratus]|jgi:hypothetical protein|uniref:Uncharacterized protein n=1 Tax=Streptomyces atratus TaxID=1893 RepID=A0A1K2F2Y8_STRAR|nr:hypothetical protein SAMN02787144_102943 [Streptomyces atratus]